jgi:hypothetical protein
MNEFKDQVFTDERSLFGLSDARLFGCNFEKGESPLKQSRGITTEVCNFSYKYPLWYSKDITMKGGTFFQNARAGIWYSDNVTMSDHVIIGPKNFRRCHEVTIENTLFTDAKETLWYCSDVFLKDVNAKGDYFAMGCNNIEVRNLTLDGNYSFDGCRNVVVRDSRLLSKDAFWNCEDVTIFDSYICGEYIAWNSKNVRLIGCTIESLQGLCYVEDLVLERCNLPHTTLAFEYSKGIKADINGSISSIFNPGSGSITCDRVEELIIEKDKVDPGQTQIVCKTIDKKSDIIDWNGRY